MLFEIELNPDFKILDRHIFFEEREFKKFYKSNNLNDGYDDNIDAYLLEKYTLDVDNESILASQDISFYYEIDEILRMISSNVYSLCGRSDEKKLYPEWLLFYIADKKRCVSIIHETTFDENLEYFKHIAEMRYKEYVIINIKNFISFTEYKHINEIKDTLKTKYLEYTENIEFDRNRLFNFLDFLYSFHFQLKNNEKYKLMWNIEIYIDRAIQLLKKEGVASEDIYKKISEKMCVGYSESHNIDICKPEYIKDSKECFSDYFTTIQNIFGDKISLDDLMETIITKPEYENLIFSYMELIKRFDSNKISEIVMSALTRSIMLDIEEILSEKFDCSSRSLYKDYIKKLCTDSLLLKEYHQLISQNISNNDFFNKLNELSNKDDSLEKYFMIYYHSRNYVAHKNIDLYRFFKMEDGKNMVNEVIRSMMIILYRVEALEQ